MVTDEAAVYLMRHLYASVPQVVEAYKALPLPVLKADFFRYLILLARGGIYSDIDTTALQSTTDWLPKEFPRSTIGLIIGIEADPDREDWKAWFSRRIQFCQWTIQAKPGHPVLREIVASLTEEILQTKKAGTLKSKSTGKNVVEFTGPARWTDTVFDYLNDPRYFDMRDDAGSGGKVKNITWEAFTGMETAKKIGDVVVLPITSFSPGVQQMGAKEPDDPMAFVQHEFEGTLEDFRSGRGAKGPLMLMTIEQEHGSPKARGYIRRENSIEEPPSPACVPCAERFHPSTSGISSIITNTTTTTISCFPSLGLPTTTHEPNLTRTINDIDIESRIFRRLDNKSNIVTNIDIPFIHTLRFRLSACTPKEHLYQTTVHVL